MCNFYTYAHACGHTYITWVSHCKKGAMTQQKCAWEGTVLADLELERACQNCCEAPRICRQEGQERCEKRSRMKGAEKERR